MDNRESWRLCGGTFFILISNARKQLPSKGEMYAGKKSCITEPETIMALARVVTPDIEEPMGTENKSMRDGTSDFKACRGWGWCPPTEGNNERPYEASVGEDSDRRGELTYCMPSNFMDYEEKKTSDEDEEPESEVLDAVLEHEEQSAQPNLKQNINNLVIFNLTQNQYGNGKMFGYVADYHEKDED